MMGGKMKAEPFRGHVVIVTGASAGIGRALALRLAGQGGKVVVAARRLDRLEQVAAGCRELGGEALAIRADVGDEGQCKALIEQTIEAFGRLDMLVNNAGLAVSGLFEEFPNLHLFKHVLDVNFYGAVYCTYYALPYLIRTKGRIVAISSLGGKVPLPFNTPYIASKYAMHGFYDSLRIELSHHRVSATIICPYWVVTEFHEAQMDKTGVPRGERGRQIHTRKMMTAEQCADIVLKAAEKRKREVLMGPGGLAVWLKVLAPGLLDKLVIKIFLKPIIRRVKASQAKQE
jgi:short-subunit dehydrogenase